MAAQIQDRDPSSLRPYANNARTHSMKQLKQIAASIERFGFTNPVLISEDNEIIAGHGRVEAAKMLGHKCVPTILLSHLTDAERRAYVLADNKLALNAGWDRDILAIELQGLIDLDFELELTGFSLAETDFILDDAAQADPQGAEEPEDAVPPLGEIAVSRRSDVWLLGRHKLICGDARMEADYEALLGGERADLVFTDPPYNVQIDGHVSGLGSVRHREFAFASGEMSKAQFTTFLTESLTAISSVMRDGAIAYVCMDWRHMAELLAAGEAAFTELKNLVVWNKTNGGMGAFYRSKHELIFVFKNGTAEHTNSFGLGETGRYRTNVWDHAGISSMTASRADELAMHPTVKPVALVADAIKDCSRRGEIVLDAFGGSGSTLVAAEKTGRSARLIEFDPLYCDTIVEEAYRPVTIREGNEVFEIPAIQAVMRAMGVAAMKGNRLSQKNLAEMVQRVEAAEKTSRMENLESFLDYKIKWTEEIERCQKAGLPDPAPIPHPDDVILNFRDGTTKINGPLTKEEKVEWDKRLQRRSDAQSEVIYFAGKHRKARDPKMKELWLWEWHLEQRIFDFLNDSFPDRYKAKLQERSYYDGASKEGQTLSAYIRDRQKPKHKREWS